jgi:MFS family permease
MELKQSLISSETLPPPYRTRPVRFLVLLLLSLVVVGNQYAFNNPQALEETMEETLSIS